VLAVLLAGCVLKTSQPARLFVLDPVAAASGAPAAPSGLILGVLRVTVPDWMDRPEITSRTAAGQIAPDDYARWGEPIERGFQRVIAENLATLLPDRQVARAPFSTRQAVDHRVEIAFAEAARQGDGTVLLDARWTVFGEDGAVLVQRRSPHRAGPAGDSAGTVRAMNEALAALSREIADAVRALPAPETSPRPDPPSGPV
jgi:uncharacterized lipoprotein YmbA